MSVEELLQLRLTDYDPARTTLAVRRGARVFTVMLDPVVLDALVTWLRMRVSRWPRTSNPHLLITDFTAITHAPISRYGLTAAFRLLGITARQLRVDRILDEAAHAADPVQLMRVFGLGVGASVRYVRAAHPEKFRRDPTSP
ncbi:site-specific integrase [Saccharothrix stipae]